jgi:Spy/CpxP family protein refolding chaperone
MRTSHAVVLFSLLLSAALRAQTPAPPPAPPGAAFGVATRAHMGIRRELGEWWKNSDIARKLQLTEAQRTQLDQTFLDHRMRLIDYQGEVEKQDLKLQSLLDADRPDDGQINVQIDQVLDARGKLEREFTMMSLDLRRVLSLAQWRQLRSIRSEQMTDRVYFFKKAPAPGMPGAPMSIPLPPPPPDDMNP